jgi:predicted dehydrogenase
LLCRGGIGRPLHAEFALLQGHNYLPDFPRSSALLDSGVHLFDTLAGLAEAAGLGTVAQVCAAPLADGNGLDFCWGFISRTTAGTVLSAVFSRSALGWRNGLRWSLYGEDGAISVELDSGRTEARLARRGDERPQGVWRSVPLPADLQADDDRFPAYHMDRLVAAVRGEERFPGFAEAVATHRLADALAASAATGRWTNVER